MVERLLLAAAADASATWHSASSSDVRVAVVLVAATLLYLAYNLLIAPRVVARLFPRRATNESDLRTTGSFFRKGAGAILFGVIPAAAMALAWPGGLAACGLTFAEAPRSLLYALGFIALMLPLLVFQARKPSFRLHYPEVRRPLTGRTALWNTLGWAAYLSGYELFFRGILVLALAPLVGPLPALTLALMAYVFVHLGRYAGETVGTLFTGTLFGVVALDTGSILMPFLAHFGVALLADFLAARPVSADA